MAATYYIADYGSSYIVFTLGGMTPGDSWSITSTAGSSYARSGTANSSGGAGPISMTGLNSSTTYTWLIKHENTIIGRITTIGGIPEEDIPIEPAEADLDVYYANIGDDSSYAPYYDPDENKVYFQITWYVENLGDSSGSGTIYYSINGNPTQTRTVSTVSAGGERVVSSNVSIAWYSDVYTSTEIELEGYITSEAGDRDFYFSDTLSWDAVQVYEDFYWGDGSSYISPGDDFSSKITEKAWLNLINLVNFLKGTSISTSGVSTGSPFKAQHYNNIANALNLPTVSSGEECTADLFNTLRTAYYEQAGLL